MKLPGFVAPTVFRAVGTEMKLTLLHLSNLVPSSLPTRLRHGRGDSGEIEFLTNFYWLLENNDS